MKTRVTGRPAVAGAIVVAAAAGAVVAGLTAVCSTSARPGRSVPASPSRSPAAWAVVSPFPLVNRPCQGKVPEPFAGVATRGNVAANVAAFRSATRAHLHVVEVYSRFPGPFWSAEAQRIISMGALPLIQLNPRHVGLAQVAAGAYDGAIRRYARQVRTFGCDVILSFGHEMNGWWYPWGLPRTTPSTFKAAWRHVYDVFAAERVRNVIWSWDPTRQQSQLRPRATAYAAARWYPGNRYVDWIGVDGYFGRGQNFNDVFGHLLRDVRRVTSKPIYIAETAVGDGIHQGRQMASLFAGVRRWRLIGLVWFDLNRKNSWSLQGKPAKDAAFRRGIVGFP